MQIIVDDQVIGLEELCSTHQVIKIPGNAITRKNLQSADVLLVRSITPVNEALLAGTPVKFVGTFTSGTDHLDLAWLHAAGIQVAHAKGTNTATVVEYILCCIAALQKRELLVVGKGRAGVIGVGDIGSKVVNLLKQLGFEVIMYDPPRAVRDENFISVPLSEWQNLDLICVHLELTKPGVGNHSNLFPSFHLLDHDFLQRQHTGCVLINVARGGIIATEDLLQNSHLTLCLDVWENEPNINLELLQRVTIGTPHMAGYSQEARSRGVLVILQQLQHYLEKGMSSPADQKNQKMGLNEGAEKVLEKGAERVLERGSENLIQNFPFAANNWQDIAIASLDLFTVTEKMRASLLFCEPDKRGKCFETLRKLYLQRQEFLK